MHEILGVVIFWEESKINTEQQPDCCMAQTFIGCLRVDANTLALASLAFFMLYLFLPVLLLQDF